MRITSLLLILLFLGCETREGAKRLDGIDERPYVILVSIDGFRYDYAEEFNATNILAMKMSGSWAESMIPSFPSKTFPNHYSLVTGMYPGNHGIVSNKFYSKSKDDYYAIGDSNVLDGTWYGGTPLWTLAEQNKMKAASLFWVGSEAKIDGFRPTIFKNYDGSIPNSKRVDEVISWLDLPLEDRPQFITLYFSDVDSKGHKFGPRSTEVENAVLAIDEQIGRLREGIKNSPLNITLIVTSDHGMSAINEGLFLDVDWRGSRTIFSSSNVMVFQNDSSALSQIKRDLADYENINVYEKKDFPKVWNFENEDRSGDLIVTIDPPRIFSKRESVSGGTHGYDPYAHTEMHTIFYLEGPRIKPGYKINSFENVHVYPLIATMLELPIPENVDGNLDILEEVLTR